MDKVVGQAYVGEDGQWYFYTEEDIRKMGYSDDVIRLDDLPRHGSPQDRGGADAYYGRSYDPHYYTGGTYDSERVEKDNMTVGEIEAYRYGYENQQDRKEYD